MKTINEKMVKESSKHNYLIVKITNVIKLINLVLNNCRIYGNKLDKIEISNDGHCLEMHLSCINNH